MFVNAYLAPGAVKARNEALGRYALRQCEPEAQFNRLAALAAAHFKTKCAVIGVWDEDFVWGLGVFGTDIVRVSVEHTFSAALENDNDAVVVLDTQADGRFAGGACVMASAGFRFRAHVTLRTEDGIAIGALSIMDDAPRTEFTLGDMDRLRALADIVMDAIAQRAEVTRRQRAELELADREQKMRLFGDNTNDLIILVDLNNKPLYASPSWGRIVGRSPISPDGELITGMVPPEDVALVNDSAMRAYETGEVTRCEHRLIRADGGVIWVESHTTCKKSADGAATFFCVLRDFTEQKLSREALQESEREFRRLADAMPDAVVLVGMDRIIRYASRAIERLLDCSADNLVGMPCSYLMHPDDFLEVEERCYKILDSGHDREIIEHRAMRGGEVIWLEAHVRIVYKDGAPDSFVVGLRDVSIQRLALTALAQSEERFRLLADAMPDMVMRFGLDYRLEYVSQVCVKRFEREPEGLIGRSIFEFLHPGDIPSVSARLDEMLINQEDQAVVEHRIYSGEEYIWFQAHLCLVYKNGRPDHFIDVVRDITEHRNSVGELMAARAKAESAVQAQNQFFANISHEIRTPLNGVLGVLECLRAEKLTAEGEAMLHEAVNCGHMVAQLLDDVIDFSRIEAGRLSLLRQPCNIEDVLQSVVNMLRPQAEAKGLQLLVEVEGENKNVLADQLRVRQVLFNLLGNAVKYTRRGRVIARLIAEPAPQPGRRLIRIEIEDTGIGVADEQKAHLFTRFYQAGGNAARRMKGSGLGLTIVRRLADLMGGDVGFTSQEGAGSCFWFEFETDEVLAVMNEREIDQNPLSNMRLLLVEDNAVNRLVARKLLEATGATVDVAEDGEAGVYAVKRNHYDAILMDVQMPVMDGVAATAEIRALSGERGATPIIGLTANAMEHQRQEYLAAGMDAVCAKPIAPGDLVLAIVRAKTQRRRVA